MVDEKSISCQNLIRVPRKISPMFDILLSCAGCAKPVYDHLRARFRRIKIKKKEVDSALYSSILKEETIGMDILL